jgi:hypothetical protein
MSQADLTKWVEKQIGKSFTKLMEEKSGSRLSGLIQRRGSEWRKAFEHIRFHFGPVKGKPTHATYLEKYCSEDAVAQLVADAARRSSQAPIVTRLTSGGVPSGEPAILIQRWFGDAIGYSDDASRTLKNPDCSCLLIVMNYRGDLISAYPTKALIPG